jgi:hypothetical protein
VFRRDEEGDSFGSKKIGSFFPFILPSLSVFLVVRIKVATELVLSRGDGRVRVIFQHAPVWARGVEPGSGPPSGLKLFRCTLSREARRASPPTAETEQRDAPEPGNPVFYRPVPPFHWHKHWAGTSWTWGPEMGNRGWSIADLEEEDAWHGSAPVELWNLRLPGGIFVQTPRVITSDEAGLCRLAWLPDDETLLRIEAGVLALQPVELPEGEVAGFAPPSLASLRCDVLTKMGDLEGEPSFVKQSQATEGQQLSSEEDLSASDTAKSETGRKEAFTATQSVEQEPKKPSRPDDDGQSDADIQAIRDAIQL